MTKKLWFVDFPTYRYKENVKEVAAKNMARVIDAKFRSQYSEETLSKMEYKGKLTLKPEFQKKAAEEEK